MFFRHEYWNNISELLKFHFWVKVWKFFRGELITNINAVIVSLDFDHVSEKKYHHENAKNDISERLDFEIFWGSRPPCPPQSFRNCLGYQKSLPTAQTKIDYLFFNCYSPFETRKDYKEIFLTRWLNYKYLDNSFAVQYFKADCDAIAVTMKTLKVHKKNVQISVFVNYLKS